MDDARRRGFDGVVCGHIHKPEARPAAAGLPAYFNCGDWVETASLLVEHDDGRMEIIDGHSLLAQLDARGFRALAEPADFFGRRDAKAVAHTSPTGGPGSPP